MDKNDREGSFETYWCFITGNFAAIGTAVGGLLGVPFVGAGLGVLVIIILPIYFGIIGFIFGAIGAFLYNLIAGKVGGVELEFDQ